MIITRTPYRISFFGGGTDYPAWYRQEGGAVLSTTIDKHCYISCRHLPPFFSIRHRIVWSHIETVQSSAEILHPAVRHGLRYLEFAEDEGLEIHHQGDLPARSGIGSSSTFSVGLIKALLALRGQIIGKHELALRAIELEQEVMRERVGSQDQVAAAYGGLNVIRFRQNGSIQVEPVPLGKARIAEIEESLLLFYTGSSRLGGEIAGRVIAGLQDRAGLLRRMHAMVEEGAEVLLGSNSLARFGELLDEGWQLKRQLAEGVTNSGVDAIYRAAREAGALGGKLLGAGAAGFVLFMVPPERRNAVCQALSHLLCVPFRFDWEGSTTIYHDTPDAGGWRPPGDSSGARS